MAEETPTSISEPTIKSRSDEEMEAGEEENKGAEEESLHSTSSSSDESDTHPLGGFTDQQVVDAVKELDDQNRHIAIENDLLMDFISKNDPEQLDNLEEIVQVVLNMKEQKDRSVDRLSLRSSSARHTSVGSYVGMMSLASGKGPKINLTHKNEMVVKATEEEQSSLDEFLKRSRKMERNLKTQLEEFAIRHQDIIEATNIFEFNVVTQGMDPLTQRIPAEKFVRYMEEWLKSAHLQIEKLRLRLATYRLQYQKVSQQLLQRQELGENVHAVDFDQLVIENKHLEANIEQKNMVSVELKRMNGGANLVLSTHKKYLQQQQKDVNQLRGEIARQENEMIQNEIDLANAEEELRQESEKYEKFRKLKAMYKVPDVMEYVNLKSKLNDLKKNIKIWSRRKTIQDIALSTCIRQLKSLRGISEINPIWFEDSFSLEDPLATDSLKLF